jgi:hypothetical protein
LFLISRDAWLGNFEIRTFNASSRRISTFPVFTAPINYGVASYNPRAPLIHHFAAPIAPHEVLLDKDLPAASGFATAAARAVIQRRCRSQQCRLLSGLYQAHTSILLQHRDSKEVLLYVNRFSNLKGHDNPRIKPATLRSLSPNRAKSLLQKLNNPSNELLEQSMRCCSEKQVFPILIAMSDVSTRSGFGEQS